MFGNLNGTQLQPSVKSDRGTEDFYGFVLLANLGDLYTDRSVECADPAEKLETETIPELTKKAPSL